MVKRWNRLLVAFFVLSDALLGMIAFVLAYILRFETGLIEAPQIVQRFFEHLPIVETGDYDHLGMELNAPRGERAQLCEDVGNAGVVEKGLSRFPVRRVNRHVER